MKADFVPLTEDLLTSYLGEPSRWTRRGFAVIYQGETVGVFGYYRDRGHDIAFADFKWDKTEMPPPVWVKRAIVKALRLMEEMRPKRNVYAYAEPTRPGSDVLLEHMGFHHLRDGIYQWQ